MRYHKAKTIHRVNLMAKRISIFWIVILGLLLTSAIPVAVMAYSAIHTAEVGIETEQTNQLGGRANAHASTIDQQFQAFETATQLTAAQATKLLTDKNSTLTDQQITDRLSKYSRDSNNVYGLDA